MRIFLMIIFIFYCIEKVFSQAGNLDSTFGGDGRVITDLGTSFTDYGNSMAFQKDGKILLGGFIENTGISLIRYLTNGAIDSSFAVEGVALWNPPFSSSLPSIALQQDGKILQGGQSDGQFALHRYDTFGIDDPTFGNYGSVYTAISNLNNQSGPIAIQKDGKILMAGSCYFNTTHMDFGIVRYEADGSLDNSFGTDGMVTVDFEYYTDIVSTMQVQSDGKILLGGWGNYPIGRFELVRLNTNGSLDATFGLAGKLTITLVTDPSYEHSSELYDFSIQADGKIIVTGYCYDDVFYKTHLFKLMRLNSDGSLDNSFGNAGIVSSTNFNGVFGYSTAIQADGKILLAGDADYNPVDFSARFGLERYNPDGSLDTSFGDSGLVIIDFSNGGGDHVLRNMKIDNDGKILLSGTAEYLMNNYSNAIARVLSGLNVGIINLTISDAPPLIYPNPIYTSATLEYTLTETQNISIKLYNLLGEVVQTFITNQNQNEGEHKEVLNFNEQISAGEYLLSISNGMHEQVVKVTVAK